MPNLINRIERKTHNMEGEELYNYTDSDLDRFMEMALSLVEKADELIKANITKAKALPIKSPDVNEGHSSHVLTETDQAVEDLLIKGLSTAFPDHK